MRILYAIQGTGNGHISRARDIIPELKKYAEVDILISGIQADVSLPFSVKYKLHGLSFIFGKKGGVDVWQTFRKCLKKKFFTEVSELPVQEYDLVVNDFEPISAWAARIRKVPCVSLSHQWAVIDPMAPQPDKFDPMGKFILNNYAPCQWGIGFHFKQYSADMFTPVIRKQLAELLPDNKGHYTVYLPAYDDEKIIKQLLKLPYAEWEVFSKHATHTYRHLNILVTPIQNELFINSMATSEGVLCGAGFETPAEAMYLGKKLLVIPMKTQYEQQCNAAALAEMGVPVVKSLKTKHLHMISEWMLDGEAVKVHFPDVAGAAVQRLIAQFETQYKAHPTWTKLQPVAV